MATLKFQVMTVYSTGEIAILKSPCALDPALTELKPSKP